MFDTNIRMDVKFKLLVECNEDGNVNATLFDVGNVCLYLVVQVNGLSFSDSVVMGGP